MKPISVMGPEVNDVLQTARNANRQGGTLKGVQARLEYIADPGMKAVWLSPVLKNARPDDWPWNYHGYGTQDFLTVDERLGRDQDLEELVAEGRCAMLPVSLAPMEIQLFC